MEVARGEQHINPDFQILFVIYDFSSPLTFALSLSPTIDLLFDNHINVRVPKYTTLWNSSLMAGLVGCAVVDIHSSFTGFRLLAAACQKRSIGGRKTGKFAHVRSDSCHVQMTP